MDMISVACSVCYIVLILHAIMQMNLLVQKFFLSAIDKFNLAPTQKRRHRELLFRLLITFGCLKCPCSNLVDFFSFIGSINHYFLT
uniref:Uncharacterized protein n=1 Tax=Nelumbo nucifera TaxID=4432 RepID=A0A822YCY4_NELNU|nr:TPA_asm: hypothetical protein HUJ06_030303 [Nelumbo nucifera]